LPVIAVLGSSRDASFENEKQPDGWPSSAQTVEPGQLAQLLPVGPPIPWYSSALNWYTVTGTLETRWYAAPCARTLAENGTASPQLSASCPFSTLTHGR
jgi:hypothetical protein